MAKYIFAVIGVFFICFGGMDGWLFGISVPHDSHLVGIGIMILLATFIIAGIMFFRQKSRKPKAPLVRVLVTIALCGVSDACAETIHAGTLTPPDVTPMIQRSLVTGAATWAWILPIVALGLFFWWLYIPVSQRGSGWRGRRR